MVGDDDIGVDVFEVVLNLIEWLTFLFMSRSGEVLRNRGSKELIGLDMI